MDFLAGCFYELAEESLVIVGHIHAQEQCDHRTNVKRRALTCYVIRNIRPRRAGLQTGGTESYLKRSAGVSALDVFPHLSIYA